jgi:hypothetical protein
MTLYNVAMYPTKKHIQQGRYNDYHPMDKPVFRWTQRNSEFYSYDIYREMIDMGVIANDPFVLHMQSIGKGKDLLGYTEDRGWGWYGSKGRIVPDYLPRQDRYSHGHNTHMDPTGAIEAGKKKVAAAEAKKAQA